jgi:hypothetical protein
MPFVNMHAITREHTPPEVPHHLQPHLAGRGFIATELVLLTGAVFGAEHNALALSLSLAHSLSHSYGPGALAGYWFTFAVAPRRHSWPRAVRLSFAAVLAVVGMALGYFDSALRQHACVRVKLTATRRRVASGLVLSRLRDWPGARLWRRVADRRL